MNLKSALKRPVLFGAAALTLLAACGNAPGGIDAKQLLRQTLPGQKTKPKAVDIDAALKATTDPLALVLLEKTNSQSPILRIESNGAYHTYATPSRQTLTLRQGVVTATRGLSNDLMSSDVDDTLRLLSAHKEGKTRRVMRYLDGEEQIVALTFDCDMRFDRMEKVDQGEVTAQTWNMDEFCTGAEGLAEGLSFTNTYLVDASGQVLTSRQWLSPNSGTAILQILRR